MTTRESMDVMFRRARQRIKEYSGEAAFKTIDEETKEFAAKLSDFSDPLKDRAVRNMKRMTVASIIGLLMALAWVLCGRAWLDRYGEWFHLVAFSPGIIGIIVGLIHHLHWGWATFREKKAKIEAEKHHHYHELCRKRDVELRGVASDHFPHRAVSAAQSVGTLQLSAFFYWQKVLIAGLIVQREFKYLMPWLWHLLWLVPVGVASLLGAVYLGISIEYGGIAPPDDFVTTDVYVVLEAIGAGLVALLPFTIGIGSRERFLREMREIMNADAYINIVDFDPCNPPKRAHGGHEGESHDEAQAAGPIACDEGLESECDDSEGLDEAVLSLYTRLRNLMDRPR